MLVACWPTQMWFTRLLSLLIEQLITIQVTQNLLTHPLTGNVHPFSPELQLLACKVSGNILLPAKFQKTFQCAHALLVTKHSNYTTSTLKSGPPFVFNRKLILGNQMSMMCSLFFTNFLSANFRIQQLILITLHYQATSWFSSFMVLYTQSVLIHL